MRGMDIITRQPVGRPQGGQFAPHSRESDTIDLTDDKCTPYSAQPQRGVWTIYDPTIQESDNIDGFTFVTMERTGQPHLRARARAAAAALASSRADAVSPRELAAAGEKMTVLVLDEAGVVRAIEGTGKLVNGEAVLMRKASLSGWRIDRMSIVDCTDGYGGQGVLAERFSVALAAEPELRDVDLLDIPGSSEGRVAAAFRIDNGEAVETFLVSHADTNLVHGHIWGPDGLMPESIYLSDLQETAGRVRHDRDVQRLAGGM